MHVIVCKYSRIILAGTACASMIDGCVGVETPEHDHLHNIIHC